MLDAGMNVAKIDLGNRELDTNTCEEIIENLKMALQQRPECSCSVMLDTPGPDIRIGNMRDDKTFNIDVGQTI